MEEALEHCENIESTGLTWRDALGTERQAPYFKDLLAFVDSERANGHLVFPPKEQVFHSLALTALGKVRVVILGQDPYHGPGQAHGLCFSVARGVPPPPSLKNIFKELATDVGTATPSHGCLEYWAEQGVLLLNAVLTVRASEPGSHAGKGWETFTDRIIQVVNDNCKNVVFILWGAYAQTKGSIVDGSKHLVLSSAHPSPFSANRGFFGCGHFSKTNHYLMQHGLSAIDWQIK